MRDIKTDFREWLVKTGVSERTSTGRPGTVYEYTRLLNKICDFIYKKHDIEHWQQLAFDIYQVLGIHILCKNGETVISKDNIAGFLSDFLDRMKVYQDNLNSYLSITIQNMNVDKFNYSFLRDLLPSITDQQIICKFLISELQRQKHRMVLTKFYHFLSDSSYSDDSLIYYKKFESEDDVKKHYQYLNDKLSDITKASDYNQNEYELMSKIVWGNGLAPPKIDDSVDKEAYPQTVMEVLRISKRTLGRLSEKFLHPLENGNFSVAEVNKFIQDNFVPSPDTSDFSYKDKWWTAKEAHEKTGIHRRQIQRLRNEKVNENHVAHVKISSEIYLYYPPDVKQQCKNKTI